MKKIDLGSYFAVLIAQNELECKVPHLVMLGPHFKSFDQIQKIMPHFTSSIFFWLPQWNLGLKYVFIEMLWTKKKLIGYHIKRLHRLLWDSVKTIFVASKKTTKNNLDDGTRCKV